MLRFKRGDSVQWPTSYTVDGVPVDLTDYTITSQVRTRKGELVVSFTITKSDQTLHPGEYLLSLTSEVSSTATVGVHEQDIQYSVGGVVQSTETIPCVVDIDQTRPV